MAEQSKGGRMACAIPHERERGAFVGETTLQGAGRGPEARRRLREVELVTDRAAERRLHDLRERSRAGKIGDPRGVEACGEEQRVGGHSEALTGRE